MNFSHLHNHTDYSTLDGIAQIDQLVKRSKELGFSSLAITDHGNIDGAFKFHKECIDNGIKPIIGCEIYFCWSIEDKEHPYHLTVLVQNKEGWANLLKLTQFANTIGAYYKPRVSWDKLCEHSEGLIVLSGCLGSPICKPIKYGNTSEAETAVDKFREVFGKRFYLELMDHGLEDQVPIRTELKRFGKNKKIRCVATNDVHYVLKEHSHAQEIAMAAGTKKFFSDNTRPKLPCNEFYLKSYEEMLERHSKEHLDVSDIVNSIDFEIEKEKFVLPEFPKGEIEKRIKKRVKVDKLPQEYKDRLDEELKVIYESDLSAYLLTVANYVEYANNNKMFAGPGRGSAAGCLVAYYLGIHNVDPVKYGLLFSRFYNKGRKGSLPDIDIDFSIKDIETIKHYMESEYGKNNVAMIGTHSSMSGKSALKTVCRVMEIPFAEANKYSKLMGDFKTIDEAIEYTELGLLYVKDETLRKIADVSRVLEGCVYSASIHAAGIVVSDKKEISNICPTRIDEKTGILVTCWDMDDIEGVGLLKFDFLSLATLDVIQDTINAVSEIESYHDIPMGFKPAYKMLMDGNGVGVFQIKSEGITELCRKIKPKDIDDLAVIVALYRPGPLMSKLDQHYIRRKFKREQVEYKHPRLENSLKKTYGLPIFQENITRILIDLAGFSEHEADHVRKVIGKKLDDAKMKAIGEDFISRCENNGIDRHVADSIWSDIQYFNGYAFNACISGETIIYRGNSGGGNDTPTIRHLYKLKNDRGYSKSVHQYNLYKKLNREGYGEILALDGDGRIRPRKIKNIGFSGRKPTFIVTLSNGTIIRATKDHKFFSTEGFITVGEIKVNVTELIADNGYEKTLIGGRFSKEDQNWKSRPYAESQKGFDFGEGNPAYTNGSYSEFAKSVEILKNIDHCQRCGITGVKFEHHHADGNRENSNIDNIEKLCNSCHKKADYELGKRKKRWSKGHCTTTCVATSIEYFGVEATFDIEMDTSEHNFIANGIVSSNSHSVSYGYLTYYTAYLKSKYPIQFMTALMNNYIGKPDQISKYLRETYKLGIAILPPIVGIAKDEFTIYKDAIMVGYAAINGLGWGSADKINSESLIKFLTESTINKTAISAIIKMNGCKQWNSNRAAVLDYHEKLLTKKINKKKLVLFDRYYGIEVNQTIKPIDDKTIASWEFDLIGEVISFNIFELKWFKQNELSEQYVLRCIEEGLKCKVSGIVTEITNVLTKKKKEPMALVQLYTTIGYKKIVVFPKAYSEFGHLLVEGNVVAIVCELKEEDGISFFADYIMQVKL